MNIIVTGGGTGGHITPALAIADYAKENIKDAKILYVGTPNGMEKNIVEKAGYDFFPIELKGLRRSFSPAAVVNNFKAVYLANKAKSTSRKLIKDFKPDIVIGTGGYVTGPILLTAAKMGIKSYIHESNAYPGVTTKLLAKHATHTFVSTKDAIKHLPKEATTSVVGNPLREAILSSPNKEKSKEKLNIKDEFVILSVGGSLGADVFNRMMADLISKHRGLIGDRKIYHKHGYGKKGKDKFFSYLKGIKVDPKKVSGLELSEYIDNIDEWYAVADIVICRAGAMTISELSALGKCSILVPSPNVTENHQYHNGMSLVNKDAAFMIEEKEYTKEKLVALVTDLIDNKEKKEQTQENASSLKVTNTLEKMFDIMLER